MSIFSEKITPATTGLPQAALNVVIKSLEDTLTLINEHNARVQRINEAKASDPNNVEVLDAKWRQLASQGHKDFVKREQRYQTLVAEIDKLEQELREDAKKHIQPPLSEDEQRTMRKQVNEGRPAIEAARAATKGQAEMVDAMLEGNGKAIEGGVISLLPELDSLKGARGRKSGEGKAYATRANDILIDGKSVGKDGGGRIKVNFAIAAEHLSARFNSSAFPENGVSATELEEAYFKSLNLPMRSKDIPDSHEFEFTKDVVREGKNGGTVSEPVTVKVKHEKWTQEGKPFTAEK